MNKHFNSRLIFFSIFLNFISAILLYTYFCLKTLSLNIERNYYYYDAFTEFTVFTIIQFILLVGILGVITFLVSKLMPPSSGHEGIFTLHRERKYLLFLFIILYYFEINYFYIDWISIPIVRSSLMNIFLSIFSTFILFSFIMYFLLVVLFGIENEQIISQEKYDELKSETNEEERSERATWRRNV